MRTANYNHTYGEGSGSPTALSTLNAMLALVGRGTDSPVLDAYYIGQDDGSLAVELREYGGRLVSELRIEADGGVHPLDDVVGEFL